VSLSAAVREEEVNKRQLLERSLEARVPRLLMRAWRLCHPFPRKRIEHRKQRRGLLHMLDIVRFEMVIRLQTMPVCIKAMGSTKGQARLRCVWRACSITSATMLQSIP